MSDIIQMPSEVKKIIGAQPKPPTPQEAEMQLRDDIVGAINAGASNGVSRFACAAILSTIWFQVQADILAAGKKSPPNGQ